MLASLACRTYRRMIALYPNELRREYDKHFGQVSERIAQGWVQVFP